MIGKFKNEEELLKSYTELEKEFTQKCQQVSSLTSECEELTKKISGTSQEEPPQQPAEPVTVPIADDANANDGLFEQQLQQYVKDNPEVVRQVLQELSPEYDAPQVIGCGGNLSLAMPNRPKTIKEASILAQELFKK